MNSVRETVIEALQILSSKEAQYDVLCRSEEDPERKTPLNLANELWASWIQETYLPERSDFASTFSAETFEGLERFTAFFKGRLPLLPSRFETLMTDTHWLSVMEYANVLLAQLAHDDPISRTNG